MDFNIYSYTNKGARDYNEDSCGYWQEDERGAFVLADGLGGHGCGEIASSLAVDYILSNMKENFQTSDNALIELINGANMEIINNQTANPRQSEMKTTIAAAFISENTFKYFNVGDSRVYYFKNGNLYTQSKDHSVSQMAVDLGEITKDEIRFHDDRSKLLKVLGDTANLNIPKIEPEIKTQAGDAFLICSDGFWEYVYETEMELDLAKSDSPQNWCEYMCKRLLLRVSNRNDNFTVICGITKTPAPEPAWDSLIYPTFINKEIPTTSQPQVTVEAKKLSKRAKIIIAVTIIIITAGILSGIILFCRTPDDEHKDAESPAVVPEITETVPEITEIVPEITEIVPEITETVPEITETVPEPSEVGIESPSES